MRSDPPITLLLNQCAEADQPRHMERVAGNNIEKNEQRTRAHRENKDMLPKRKATSVIWSYFGYKKDDIDQTHVLCHNER